MSADPKVSVIMNCLDCERYLPAALASVQAQSFQNLEIIFWDNGSKDGSADLAQDFGPQLRYFRSRETVPLGAARNLAIAQARGEYIAFLDCDDLWRPGKLARQIARLDQDQEIGLICTDTEISDGRQELRRLFAQSRPASGRVFAELMERQWISMSSAVVRKKALQDIATRAGTDKWFDESLNVCEEADVFYRIAHDWKCDYIDEPLTVWRVHGANTTFRKFGQFADETSRILARYAWLYPEFEQKYPATIALLRNRATFQKAVSLWQEGNAREARQIIGPHTGRSMKYRLFWWASFLPGSAFGVLAKIYFALPAWARR